MGVGGRRDAPSPLPPGIFVGNWFLSLSFYAPFRLRRVTVKLEFRFWIFPIFGKINTRLITSISMGLFLKYYRYLNAETDVYAGLLVYRHVTQPLLIVGCARVATNGHGALARFCRITDSKMLLYPSADLSFSWVFKWVSQFFQKIQGDFYRRLALIPVETCRSECDQ